MREAKSTQARRRGGRWFLLAGLLFLTVLGWYFGFHDLGALLRGAAPVPLAHMVLLILAGFWIRALKWHYALGRGQRGIGLFFLAKTAGNWTPGRAGELAPLLLKQHRTARVAAWIGLDRVIEVAWTLGLGLVGAISLGLITSQAWLVIVLVTLAGTSLCFFLLRHHSGPAEEPDPGWPGRGRALVWQLRGELLLFMNKLPACLALTLVAKLTDIYAVIYLCTAFGYSTGLLLVCAARCAHGLVSAIPVTPDATGVPFVAAAWLLHAYADIPYETLTAALALEVIAINAILWACFCLVSAGRWTSTSTE